MKFIKKLFAFFLSIFLVFSVIGTNNTKIKNNPVLGDTTTQLKILEVQPGTSYDLQSYNNTKVNINNVTYTLNITSMPMSQYISIIDQINGEYDVVYIGNNTSGGVHYMAIGPNATPGVTVNSATTNALITTNGRLNINQNGYQETYTDNDITYKRAGVPVPDASNASNPPVRQPTAEASGLVSFIQSGQLTLFDNTILSAKSTIKNTNLYKIFAVDKFTGTAFDNINGSTLINKIIQTSGASDVINKIVSNYNNCNKKPTLSITSQPLQYQANSGGTPNQSTIVQESDPNYKNLKFTFNMNDGSGTNHPVKADLFLDMNSDGLFQPSEALAHVQPTNGGTGFSIEYNSLPDGFCGLLQWKLEVTDTVTGTKNYITGSVDYAGTPQTLRVLQIIPENGTNFDLNSTAEFPYSSLSGVYNISVKEVKANDFSNSFANQTYTAKATDGTTVTTRLNGNYDMVIIGFADSYGMLSDGGSDIVNTDAIKEIKNFINSGQSVMFTHDTISDAKGIFPWLLSSPTSNGWGYYLKNNFRDIIGQSRYIDANNPSGDNVDGSAIPHDQYPNGKNEIGYSYGSLSGFVNEFNTTTQAKEINKGLINSFPYSLVDDPINISETHEQWFQLNLEDENVIPWYTLIGNGENPLDPRNYYYTYSKGNVTFSGSGHNSPSETVNNGSNDDELKLFANTIYKASRSADHAPIVKLNVTNGQNVSKNQNFNCSFVAEDIDGNPMPSWKFIITDQSNVQHDVTSSVLNASKSKFTGPIESNVPVNIVLPQSLLNSLNLNGNFEFTVQVSDNKGATGQDEKSLVYVTDPTISLTNNAANGYLVGDTANITLTATANNTTAGTNGSITFGTNPLNVSPSDTSAIQLISGNGWSKIGTVNYSNGMPTRNAVQTNTISLKLNKPNDTGNTYTVNNTLTYNYSGTSYNTNCPITMSVKQGTINVSVLDDLGRVIPSGTTVTLNKPDGTTETSQVDNSGIATFINEPTGHYTVTVYTPKGYTLASSQNTAIDLSFANPNVETDMRYKVVLGSPTINPSTTNWTNKDVTFSLSPPTSNNTDPTQKMQYQIDGTSDGGYVDYTANSNVSIQSEGTHTVYARTIDTDDGNVSAVSTATVKIDKTPPPTPTVTDDGSTATINFPPDVSNAQDGTCSGIVSEQYEINNGSWQTYTGPISVRNTDTVYAKSTDGAGNVSGVGQNYSFTGLNSYIVPENHYKPNVYYYRNIVVSFAAGNVPAPSDVTATVTSSDSHITISTDGKNFYSSVSDISSGTKLYIMAQDGSDLVSIDGISATLGLIAQKPSQNTTQIYCKGTINLTVKNTLVH
jgi:hypothetical protein